MTKWHALQLNYQTKDVSWDFSEDVIIPISDSLSFTRSGSFFTSGVIRQEDESPYLLMMDSHYERLAKSYKTLYERNFRLSFETFKKYVQTLLQRNHESGFKAPYQLLIYCLGGPSESFGGYNSGLSGDIRRIIFVSNALTKKPEWTFSKGIHLLTQPIQRLLADAKPTNYVSGIKSQHAINAINSESLKKWASEKDQTLEKHVLKTMSHYQSLTEDEKSNFRFLHNEYRVENANWLKQEGDHYPNLIHDALYTTQDGYVLEGPTFSVFGLTQNNEIWIVPLQGNGTNHRDDNDGKILHSTSIEWITKAAHCSPKKIIQKPMHLKDLTRLKGFFAVSGTRMDFSENGVRLQPVTALNGEKLSVITTLDFLHDGCKNIVDDI